MEYQIIVLKQQNYALKW